MKKILAVLVSLAACVILVPAQTIRTQIDSGSFGIYYGEALRVRGGEPVLQNGRIISGALTKHEDRIMFPVEGLRPIVVKETISAAGNAVSFFLSPEGNQSRNGGDFLGLFFSQFPGYRTGVAIWRYKPWNSWTKTIRVAAFSELEEWDIQCYYWQYDDGMYGAAIPLSGKGYRTTLGRTGDRFGSRSVNSFDGREEADIPQLTIAFGTDPYRLFEQLYEEGLTRMGIPEDLRKNKTYPPILETIGWCSWNASDMGKLLNEDLFVKTAKSFSDAKFPLGWMLVDDGWFNHSKSKLNTYEPDPVKFPHGFKRMIRTVKQRYGVADVGAWHAYNGYWQGINPDSTLGRRFAPSLFSYTEPSHPDQEHSPMRTCSFISPYSDSLYAYYHGLHTYLKGQGFSFVKVDNQLTSEKMCVNNFPIWDGAVRFHTSLNRSVAETFNNTIINCMDMTADAYFNFGTTSVARAVEDFFPYEKGETYNLQHGNAAAHVLQAVYNSLYFSQMVYPDFDEFQSHNPNGVFHAIARAINNGPIYITDKMGEQKFDVLRPLVYSTGKILRSETSLLPTEDCLFQVQDAKPFKAYSTVANAGLLGIWNCADADSVAGAFSPSDVHTLKGDTCAVYEYFSGELKTVTRNEKIHVSLPRLGYKLYYVIPLVEGSAVFGLVNKYNAPASIMKQTIVSGKISATLYEGGMFAASTPSKPKKITVNGKRTGFSYHDSLVVVKIPVATPRKEVRVEITL